MDYTVDGFDLNGTKADLFIFDKERFYLGRDDGIRNRTVGALRGCGTIFVRHFLASRRGSLRCDLNVILDGLHALDLACNRSGPRCFLRASGSAAQLHHAVDRFDFNVASADVFIFDKEGFYLGRDDRIINRLV